MPSLSSAVLFAAGLRPGLALVAVLLIAVTAISAPRPSLARGAGRLQAPEHPPQRIMLGEERVRVPLHQLERPRELDRAERPPIDMRVYGEVQARRAAAQSRPALEDARQRPRIGLRLVAIAHA